VKGLKRAMIRLRYLDAPLGSETDDFGANLEEAMKVWWREEGGSGAFTGYGRNSWLLLRTAKLSSGPNAGQYAMDKLALKYVRDDVLRRVYPHPANAVSAICQGLHQTDGLYGNWAIDFCAPGGTKVVAVEDAKITRLSGNNPNEGDYGPGIFGWSIHYETAMGYRYFSTHYGTRSPSLSEGDRVNCGEVLGTVGSWPGNPGRSHTHLGVTSPLGTADAKKRILEISTSPKVVT
jgi:murein DD-endopeptidase MepM/ murein hydrolase activator NlpD